MKLLDWTATARLANLGDLMHQRLQLAWESVGKSEHIGASSRKILHRMSAA